MAQLMIMIIYKIQLHFFFRNSLKNKQRQAYDGENPIAYSNSILMLSMKELKLEYLHNYVSSHIKTQKF